MHQNIVLLQILFDVAMNLIEIWVDVLIFPIQHVNPFMLLDIVLFYFVLHVKHVEFELIDDADDAVYAEVIFDRIFQGINSWEVEISFVLGRVLFFVVDAENVAATFIVHIFMLAECFQEIMKQKRT